MHKHPFSCSEAQGKVEGRGTEGKGKLPEEAQTRTHFWICLGGGKQPLRLPQITPKPTAPFLQRGI